MEVKYGLPAPLPHHFPVCSNMNVLLVDIDERNLQNLREMLVQCGYKNVWCVQVTEGALWVLRYNAIDILMSEVFMPNMDGFQLLSAVRKDFKSVQVVLFSNHEGLGHAVATRALDLGACAFYRKPISIELLRDMWQHVVVKKIRSCNEIAPNLPPQSPISANLGPKSCTSEEESVTKQKRIRDDEETMSCKIAPKNQQLRWTEDLERKFTAAVDAIRCTDQEVTASRILGVMKDMGEDALTLSQIGSHLLQQYL